jgi:hypothetical protein
MKGLHTVPNGATMDAGANAYEIKFPISPTFIRVNPSHLITNHA